MGILRIRMVKSNKYVEQLFEVPIQIRFKNEDMKISSEVLIDGDLRSISLLSGGQFKRVCLAVDLALSDIVTSRKGLGLNLAIFDEPFQNLSETSMVKCIDLLKSLNKPTIIIEHNSIAKTVVDNVFEVEFRNKISREV